MANHIPKLEKDPLEKDSWWLIVCGCCGKVIGRIRLKDDQCLPAEDAAPPALGISVTDGIGAKDRFGKPR